MPFPKRWMGAFINLVSNLIAVPLCPHLLPISWIAFSSSKTTVCWTEKTKAGGNVKMRYHVSARKREGGNNYSQETDLMIQYLCKLVKLHIILVLLSQELPSVWWLIHPMISMLVYTSLEKLGDALLSFFGTVMLAVAFESPPPKKLCIALHGLSHFVY